MKDKGNIDGQSKSVGENYYLGGPILIGVYSSVVAGVLFALFSPNVLSSGEKNLIVAVSITLSLVLLGYFLLKYLNKQTKSDSTLPETVTSVYQKQLLMFQKRFELLENQLRKTYESGSLSSQSIFTEQEKNNFLENLRDSYTQEADQRLLKQMETGFVNNFRKENEQDLTQVMFQNSRDRLLSESISLSQRGSLNLVIGIIATITAFGILATSVFYAPMQFDVVESTLFFVPRLSLSIFIQIFAFFFLGLYKSAQREKKYVHNELTNLELKFFAIEKSLFLDNESCTTALLVHLIKTERNFILEKGQSTADLEKDKVDSAAIQKLNELIISMNKE